MNLSNRGGLFIVLLVGSVWPLLRVKYCLYMEVLDLLPTLTPPLPPPILLHLSPKVNLSNYQVKSNMPTFQ